jgi:hypothetical protein
LANAGAPPLGQSAPPSQPAAQSSAGGVRHKRYLKNYILDKKLQLSYVLFVAVLSAAIAGTLGYLLNAQESYASNAIIKAAAELDESLVAEVKKELGKQDRNQVGLMLLVGLGLMTILTAYLIIMTHKVAGPLFKIGLYFDRMRDGKLPQVHALRKGDQLRDFFEKFREMDEALRDRAKAEIELYRRFLADCDAAGVPTQGDLGHRLEELRGLMKEKEASLT